MLYIHNSGRFFSWTLGRRSLTCAAFEHMRTQREGKGERGRER